MKKVRNLAIIFSILIVSTIFSLNVFGDTTFTSSADVPSSAAKGSNIVVTVKGNSLNKLKGYKFAINFDSSVLRYEGYTNTVNPWTIKANNKTSRVIFTGLDETGSNAKSGNINLLKINLSVLSTATEGNTTLTITDLSGSDGDYGYVTSTDMTKSITITAPAPVLSSNNNLGSLTITAGGSPLTLNPSFGKNVTSYTLTVPNSVDSVNVAATVEETGKATITSGIGVKNLSVGSNIVSVVVKAENNSTKTYSVTIVRENESPPAPIVSKDNNLSNLSIPGYILSPTFNPSTTAYKVNVPNGVTSVDVNAIVNDPKATVKITGNKNLSVGKNNIVVEVTAEDGSKKNYTIEVTREVANSGVSTTPTKPTTSKSSNADLKSVTGIPGLNFDPSKTTYDITVPFEISSLNVKAYAKDSKAKVSVSNANISDMEVGKVNTITVVVTAEDSTVKIYTFNVKRSQFESETGLKQLVVDGKDITDRENSDGEYEITVDKDTNKLSISAIPISEGSKVKIIGNENLKSGKNTVLVEVTDKNGFTKNYKINVDKEQESGLWAFLKSYWLLILLCLIILLILLIIYLNKNKKTIVYNNNSYYANNKEIPREYLENKQIKQLENTNIDNYQDIGYNSNDSILIEGEYEPKHADDDNIIIGNKGMNLNKIIDENNVSNVKKEVTIVKDELVGDDLLEKEYTITEKYRKK